MRELQDLLVANGIIQAGASGITVTQDITIKEESNGEMELKAMMHN